ncbi:MAG: hypothetical protein HZA53_16925 [Planctomycetes bacterium]|nr:hypothetical protein [Planctomycetota bacterium]
MLTPVEAHCLLEALCTELGFCLDAGARERLERNPPSGVRSFRDAVCAAEGVRASDLDAAVLGELDALVSSAFARAAERHG